MSDPVARLENSRRTLDKVTYTPLVLPEGAEGGGALQVGAAAEHVRLLPGEAQVAAGAAGLTDPVRAALAGFDALASAPTADAQVLRRPAEPRVPGAGRQRARRRAAGPPARAAHRPVVRLDPDLGDGSRHTAEARDQRGVSAVRV